MGMHDTKTLYILWRGSKYLQYMIYVELVNFLRGHILYFLVYEFVTFCHIFWDIVSTF